MEIAFVLGLLVIAIILFSLETISVDLVTAIILIALTTSGILKPGEAFEGFSSDFIIILGSIFIITGAIEESGFLEYLITRFFRFEKTSLNVLLLNLIIITSLISALMNNTTVTAMMINPILSIARKMKMSASKLLMPLAFASIVGGNCTMIGTSTNVAVSGYMAKAGLEPMGMFEIWHIGLIITVLLIIYMLTIGKWMLPDRADHKLVEDFGIREYLSEIVVKDNSKLVGQTIFKSDLTKEGFRIFNVIRNGTVFPVLDEAIQAGDAFIIAGKPGEILKMQDIYGVEIKSDVEDVYDQTSSSKTKLGEVLIPAKSDLIKTTIKEADFSKRFGLSVLAIHRSGQSLIDQVSDVELAVGDLLLVQGPEERFKYLYKNHNILVLEEYHHQPVSIRKGLLIMILFLISLTIGTFEILPYSVCFMIAAVFTILLKGVAIEKAYHLIDWRLLILIGGMSAFGTAMAKTGTDTFLADLIVGSLDHLGPQAILGGFLILTILLTQPMSNAAAALVVLPIALQTAEQLGVNQRTFAMGIMLSASVSLITPFEPACILVYGPGKYKFIDFLKIGGILTAMILVILYFLVPYYWPF